MIDTGTDRSPLGGGEPGAAREERGDGGQGGIRSKTVLVTGGAGAIGSHLVARLVPHNEVVVLDNLSSGHAHLLPSGGRLTFRRASILDEKALDEIFRHRFDCVFHLAAQFANRKSIDHPRRDLMINGMGTLKLLQRAARAGVGRFVYASSSCVVGRSGPGAPTPPSDDTPYAITKYLGEQYARFFARHCGLEVVTLRYYNSFGPGEYPGPYRNVIPNFFHSALCGKPLVITGTGDESRDFNYVENTVDGTVLAATSDEAVGRTLAIGSGVETTVRVLAEKINALTGNASGVRHVGRRAWDGHTCRVAVLDEARRTLGYRPRVSLDEGLARTYEWFRSVAPMRGLRDPP
jgi:UDP-glucose 4-epimerase